MTFYLLHIIGDIEPTIKGPYKSQASRDQAAFRLKTKVPPDDGIFMLNIRAKKGHTIPTIPTVAAYSGWFMNKARV